MTDRTTQLALMQRLSAVRAKILMESPFIGNLLMHLRFGFADCETAFTDMSRIVFDPVFAEQLSEAELIFVLKHEVLHCMLEHCVRGRGLIQELFNWACDLVVNSILFSEMGYEEFSVAGAEVQHLAPDGKEAYEYSAEEVYEMFLRQGEKVVGAAGGAGAQENLQCEGNTASTNDIFDRHDVWEGITQEESLKGQWRAKVRQASRTVGGHSGLPPVIRSVFDNENYRSRTNWQELLYEFVRMYSENMDFFYSPPDRRFLWQDLILPSLCLFEEARIRGIWFFVDTSGSVSEEMLWRVGGEFRAMLEQNPGMSGRISFFDTEVTEPVEFESMEQLRECRPVGGGGTSFYSVFRCVREHAQEEMPQAIVILTDGYASFPPEEAAGGIPVLWVIQGSDRRPEWGECAYLEEAEV